MMNILFVISKREKEWTDTLSPMIAKKGGNVTVLTNPDAALAKLGDPNSEFDHVIYGSFENRWKEIDELVVKRGFGRNFLTAGLAPSVAEKIRDTGINVIEKDHFDPRGFMSHFFPEGGPKEKR